MSPEAKKVLADALALPPKKRWQLLIKLLESLDDEEEDAAPNAAPDAAVDEDGSEQRGVPKPPEN